MDRTYGTYAAAMVSVPVMNHRVNPKGRLCRNIGRA